MTSHLQRHRMLHRGERFPLLALFDLAGARPDPATLTAAATRAGLPVAALRGVLSFYADLREAERPLRVCAGTSCALNGGPELAGRLPADAVRSVYCLGYCDRAPALLRGHDEVLLDGALPPHTAPEPPPPPAIRSLARESVVTRRIGRGDFSALAAARADGAYGSLQHALARPPLDLVAAIERSRERGRGGAAFPTGVKWRRCAEAPGPSRYVVANGDEGDPGSFIDRVLLEQDPHGVLEGLLLCGYAVGAREGLVFIRSEYPWAIRRMQQAIDDARAAGILGPAVLGSDFAFDARVIVGMGSYVCGEETALLNAIEGLRGQIRLRPPFPVTAGLFGAPTVVNNVETLANVPAILAMGPDAYAALGTPHCTGTKALCLNRGFARPGIVEVEMGLPLRAVLDEAGGGRDGRPLDAVLVGGPMGSILFPEDFDVPVCYGAMNQRGFQLGHGGLVAVPTGTDRRALLQHWLEFMRDESCGRCVPCALGSAESVKLAAVPQDLKELTHLLGVIRDASLCAFGQSIPVPVLRLLQRWGNDLFAADGPT